jgi:hypothetical protein
LALRADAAPRDRLLLVRDGLRVRQGSQGGYGCCIFFLVLGMLAWGAGTVWYARRRGRWPSPLSRRLLTSVLGKHSPLDEAELRTVALTRRRRR